MALATKRSMSRKRSFMVGGGSNRLAEIALDAFPLGTRCDLYSVDTRISIGFLAIFTFGFAEGAGSLNLHCTLMGPKRLTEYHHSF